MTGAPNESGEYVYGVAHVDYGEVVDIEGISSGVDGAMRRLAECAESDGHCYLVRQLVPQWEPVPMIGAYAHRHLQALRASPASGPTLAGDEPQPVSEDDVREAECDLEDDPALGALQQNAHDHIVQGLQT